MLERREPRFTFLAALLMLRCVVAAMLAATGAGAAEEPTAPGRLALETERVVVFKDGYALFVKRAVGTTDGEGSAYIDEVPDAAVLGSVWSAAEGPHPIRSTTAEWVEREELRRRETDCVTPLELLRANQGKRVSLEFVDDRVVKGRVLKVLELEPDEPPKAVSRDSSAAPPGLTPARPNSVIELAPQRGALVALEGTDAGRLVLPVADVRTISGDDLVTRMERVEQVADRAKRLVYAFGSQAQRREVVVHLMYFTPGVRWIPTYRLSGELETEAEMSLQGEILNEAEDIEGVALDLVVGVPNFRFKDAVSPLTLEQTLRHALQRAAPNLMGQALRNTMTQRAGEWRGDLPVSPEPDVLALTPELASAGSHDLFVYARPSFSLRKGARATVPVWRDRVDLRHLYTLDIGLVRNGSTGATASRQPGAAQPGEASPLDLARYRVWHQLDLENSGEVPWTTGPALLLRNGLPLGQDLLTYTPIGGSSLLPVTVAVDVRGDLKETEIERTPNALTVDRASYTLVRKRGEITVTNFKRERITARVRLSLGGKVERAGREGAITLNEFRAGDWEAGQHAINNHSDVEWAIDLDAGQAATLDYVTSFFTR